MMNDKDKLHLSRLIIESIDGNISPERFKLLNRILADSKEAVEYYDQLVDVYVQLRDGGQILDEEHCSDLSKSEFDKDLWQALAESEKTAPELEIERPVVPEHRLIQSVPAARPAREVSRFALATAIISAAAVLLAVVWLSIRPYPNRMVATFVDAIDAKWSSQDGPIDQNGILYNQTGPARLVNGIVKLEFDYGAVVTIEAPAEFELRTGDNMFLRYGRVYARVPEYATGFVVETPSSKIIDLGTEFGVKVDVNGTSDIHMMDGQASLVPGGKGRKSKAINLLAGQAREVDSEGLVADIPYNREAFVREISSDTGLVWRGQRSIDLADIVGGGNGFGTGKFDAGIETNTGERFMSPDPELVSRKITGIFSGEESYNEVSRLALIDGVFVPDSREGPVQVTSEGHKFNGFVDGREVFWGNIFNGAWHASDTSYKHNLKLAGQTYGTSENPAISIHSNQGITFDLQAVRRTMPGGKILRFSSLFGVSETVTLDPRFDPNTSGPNLGKVNCWVLIDGEERFGRESVSYLDGALQIDVEISDEDRFLTLVVTESDDRRAYDWALFARPSLLIERVFE